jgi:hypothetical protein
VNLTQASVQRVGEEVLSEEDTGTYYSITGDESTWVPNNNSCGNMFDFRMPDNYSLEKDCVDTVQFFW